MGVARVKNKVQAGDGDPRHGKESTYRNHDCRCDLCRAGVAAENRRRMRYRRLMGISKPE